MSMEKEQPAAQYPADTPLFHLVPAQTWQATDKNNVYFAATYEQDGFIHATADARLLLSIANHFYRSKPGDWLCLQMTVGSVTDTGVAVVFEPAAPVGETAPEIPGVTGDLLFPHIFGGLAPSAVLEVHTVSRDGDGRFIAIDGVT